MMPTTFRASAFNLATFCCCRCAYSGAVESIKIATISSRFINSPGPPTLCECRVYAIRLFAFVLLGIIEHEARGRRGLGAAVDLKSIKLLTKAEARNCGEYRQVAGLYWAEID